MSPDIYGDVPAIPPEFHTMPTLNHANRSRDRANHTAAVPTPAQIRRAREVARMTPQEAGALIHERAVRWRAFETGDAHMHPASWELWNLKLAQRHGADVMLHTPGACAADVTDTLDGLARATFLSDNFPFSAEVFGKDDVLSVLDVALRTRLGIACLGNRVVSVDLGNGHSLVCRTVENA